MSATLQIIAAAQVIATIASRHKNLIGLSPEEYSSSDFAIDQPRRSVLPSPSPISPTPFVRKTAAHDRAAGPPVICQPREFILLPPSIRVGAMRLSVPTPRSPQLHRTP